MFFVLGYLYSSSSSVRRRACEFHFDFTETYSLVGEVSLNLSHSISLIYAPETCPFFFSLFCFPFFFIELDELSVGGVFQGVSWDHFMLIPKEQNVLSYLLI